MKNISSIGYYEITIVDSRTDETRHCVKLNAITDYGFSKIATGFNIAKVSMGGGTDAVDPTDEDLSIPLWDITDRVSVEDIDGITYIERKYSFTGTGYDFADIWEVGAWTDEDRLFSRTVLTEKLELTPFDNVHINYTVRMIMPELTSSVEVISGVSYNVSRGIISGKRLSLLDGINEAIVSSVTANGSIIPTIADADTTSEPGLQQVIVMFGAEVNTPISTLEFGPFRLTFSPSIPKTEENNFGFTANFPWSV